MWPAGTSPTPYATNGWPASRDRRPGQGRSRLSAAPDKETHSHLFTLDLPEDDRTLSPHTGYTRAHWEAAADGLLAAALRFATPGHAPDRPAGPAVPVGCALRRSRRVRPHVPARRVPYVAGASGGKDPHGFLERYADGIDAAPAPPAGTTPSPGR
jgi:hypothetical protein